MKVSCEIVGGIMAAFLLPGGPEIWIILAVVLVIFGPTQLPKLAKMFGKSAKALKEGIDGTLADEDEKSAKTADSAPAKPAEPTPPTSDKDPNKSDES
jgi:sec-independent protein translocase protein TatA